MYFGDGILRDAFFFLGGGGGWGGVLFSHNYFCRFLFLHFVFFIYVF